HCVIFDVCVAYIGIIPFFFFMMRRAPNSTLFPYTTLFRSLMDSFHDFRFCRSLILVAKPSIGQRQLIVWFGIVRRKLGGALKMGDRKSTRLNSSHLVISYAVFCLKKKKASSPRCLWPSRQR